MTRYLFYILVSLSMPAIAIDVVEFATPEQADQFKTLTEELRCPVCQNQNLADSGAGLADDLREEIFNQVSEGKGNDEIIEFMVQRYGDFIIYRPQLKPINYLLWFGPLLFLTLGIIFLVKQLNKQNRHSSELSTEEQAELKNILNQLDK